MAKEEQERIIGIWGVAPTHNKPPLAVPALPEKRADFLRLAEHNVCGHRTEDYGEPEDNFEMIADMWSAFLKKPITRNDVAMMMILLKVARTANNGTADCYVDIAGYAACAGEIFANKKASS